MASAFVAPSSVIIRPLSLTDVLQDIVPLAGQPPIERRTLEAASASRSQSSRNSLLLGAALITSSSTLMHLAQLKARPRQRLAVKLLAVAKEQEPNADAATDDDNESFPEGQYDEDIGMPVEMTPEEMEEVMKALKGGEGARVSESGDLLGNGKLIKSIIQEAEQYAIRPQLGDEVSIHFVGTLEDGKVFDDSRRNRGPRNPFKFRLGLGHVIKGLDQGVATMCKGERALFEIDSELAYGTEGAGWKIPKGANVKFDVELIAIDELDDLSEIEEEPIVELPYGREDVGVGGVEPNGRYRWERRGQEVVVIAPVADNISQKDITSEFALERVLVMAGKEVVLKGVPGCQLDAEECCWEIQFDSDGRRCLCIHLQKKQALDVRWPDTLLREG